MKTVNTIIFSILVILILICVIQDNLMEGFFVPPPIVRMPANNSIPASLTSTSRVANNTNFNPVKMNNMNSNFNNRNMNGGRPKSAQEIMQSERKVSNSDVIATGIVAGSILNNEYNHHNNNNNKRNNKRHHNK